MRKAGRQLERDSKLAAGGWVSGKALKDSQDEARYLEERRAVTAETMVTEERLQASQLAQLRLAASGLTTNLRLARASLDALTIRAPVAGQLSGFAPQVGQSLARGERLGQVDSAGRNKLVADIDEFYLGRVPHGPACQRRMERQDLAADHRQDLSAGEERQLYRRSDLRRG